MNSKSTMSTKNGIGPSQIQPTFRQYPQTPSRGGGGHVNFVCTGMSGHTGGKLTYSLLTTSKSGLDSVFVKPLLKKVEGVEGLPNLPNLPFSEF